MDRPIFYAVAVIIAGYLPIYVLTGPSGRLFQPMADTMSFALLGSLLLTLTLAAGARFVTGSPSGVHERANRPYEWVQATCTRRNCSVVPRPVPELTMLAADLIFGASLLLIPFIGGEFMPHLDEGALWVRATMPYTISFEEASEIRSADPQHPDDLSAGHHVGSELGRPDDGTDPTGFFNVEFYVGLKPYRTRRGRRAPIHTKAELIEDIRKEARSFPESSSTTPSPRKTPWTRRRPA